MGQDENSWCLDIPSRRVLHNGAERPGYNLPSREEELLRTISLQVNTLIGTLTFIVNGKTRGLAYTNLHGVQLFPAVAMVYARQEVTISWERLQDDPCFTSGKLRKVRKGKKEGSSRAASACTRERKERKDPSDLH